MSGGALILASGSPRRREILSQLGLSFEVIPSDEDEPPRAAGQAPDAYARTLAEQKARAVAALHHDRFVLGADTIVVVDDEVLGKPADRAEARGMLAALSGRAHVVVTAVSLVRGTELVRCFHEETTVWFRALDAGACARYAESGEGDDKAGAYAIQGLGAGLVARVEGSYANVVGLPAAQVLELLLDAGALPVWP